MLIQMRGKVITCITIFVCNYNHHNKENTNILEKVIFVKSKFEALSLVKNHKCGVMFKK